MATAGYSVESQIKEAELTGIEQELAQEEGTVSALIREVQAQESHDGSDKWANNVAECSVKSRIRESELMNFEQEMEQEEATVSSLIREVQAQESQHNGCSGQLATPAAQCRTEPRIKEADLKGMEQELQQSQQSQLHPAIQSLIEQLHCRYEQHMSEARLTAEQRMATVVEEAMTRVLTKFSFSASPGSQPLGEQGCPVESEKAQVGSSTPREPQKTAGVSAVSQGVSSEPGSDEDEDVGLRPTFRTQDSDIFFAADSSVNSEAFCRSVNSDAFGEEESELWSPPTPDKGPESKEQKTTFALAPEASTNSASFAADANSKQSAIVPNGVVSTNSRPTNMSRATDKKSQINAVGGWGPDARSSKGGESSTVKARLQSQKKKTIQGAEVSLVGRVMEKAKSKIANAIHWYENHAKSNLQTHGFDYVVSSAIVSSAGFMAMQTNHAMETQTDDPPEEIIIAEWFFTVFFCLELLYRVVIQKLEFIIGDDKGWNFFDTILVLSSLMELVMQGVTLNAGVLRVLRVLRLVRVIRLVRVMRFFTDLRIMVCGIISSMHSLFWAIILLMMIMFIFAIWTMQILSYEFIEGVDDRVGEDDKQVVLDNFGNLYMTMYSLFKGISGGSDWGDFADPLSRISPGLAICFCFYICFAVFAVLNVVTGVFVENAIKSKDEDQDLLQMEVQATREKLIQKAIHVFETADCENPGELDADEFQRHLNDPAIRKYFSQLGIDVSGAQSASGLFTLLDFDCNGVVDVDEFIFGCERLKGQAKSLDLARLLHIIRAQSDRITDIACVLDCMAEKIIPDGIPSAGYEAAAAATAYGASRKSVVRPPPNMHFRRTLVGGMHGAGLHGAGSKREIKAGSGSKRDILRKEPSLRSSTTSASTNRSSTMSNDPAPPPSSRSYPAPPPSRKTNFKSPLQASRKGSKGEHNGLHAIDEDDATASQGHFMPGALHQSTSD